MSGEARRTIIAIAESKADAEAWFGEAFSEERVVCVTPRPPHRARGLNADLVLATDRAKALPPEVFRRLLEETLPCLAWRHAA